METKRYSMKLRPRTDCHIDLEIKNAEYHQKNFLDPFMILRIVRVARFDPKASWIQMVLSNFFCYLLLIGTISASSRLIFGPLYQCCFRVVQSGAWCVLGSKTLPVLCRCIHQQGRGSIFRVSDCLCCTSKGGMKLGISEPSTAQKLGDCKQKEVFCFRRLRNLKSVFMDFLGFLW